MEENSVEIRDNLISVIVPIYNRQDYLEECINSILAQDYTNIEVLLIDDGSTDSSLEICNKFAQKDSRIRVFRQKNGGPSRARNLGLEKANGDYIAFVDSDDYVMPRMYSTLLELVKTTNSKIAVCESRSLFIKEEVFDINLQIKRTIFEGEECLEQYFSANSKISGCLWDKIYSAEIFKNLKFEEDRIVSEDTAIMYKIISECNRIVCSNYIGYLYRETTDSLTRFQYNSRLLMTIITYEEMVDYFTNKNTLYVKRAQLLANGAIFFNAGEYYVAKNKDKRAKNIIKAHARKQLLEYKNISLRNRVQLFIILKAFPIFGIAYKLKKKIKNTKQL